MGHHQVVHRTCGETIN